MGIAESELPVNSDGSIYHLALKSDELRKRIIYVGDPNRTRLVAERFDSVDFERTHREFVSIGGTYKNRDVLVIGTGIGMGNVEITTVELYALNEYDFENGGWNDNVDPLTIIRIGTCGTPQTDINIGELAITKYSLGLDNMGLYYPFKYNDNNVTAILEEVGRTDIGQFNPYVSRSSENVVSRLTNIANHKGLVYHTGITAASPGFFAPQGRSFGKITTPASNIQDIYSNLIIHTKAGEFRVINNEMESSIMNRLCNIMGYQSGMVAAILAGRKKGDFLKPAEYKRAVDNAIDVGLEAIINL